jgi:hypothetical protein
MILIYVIHRDSCVYELFDRQCFWFADSISAILEKWSGLCEDASVKIDAPSGCVKGVALHRRKPEDVEKIWTLFTSQRDKMDKDRQGYEDRRQKEVAKTEELKRQVEELKMQQARERQEREREMRKQKEAERQLKTALEDRERQLIQLMMDQQRQLEEKDRERDIVLLQRERMGHCHPQELVRRIRMASSSNTRFDAQITFPCSQSNS